MGGPAPHMPPPPGECQLRLHGHIARPSNYSFAYLLSFQLHDKYVINSNYNIINAKLSLLRSYALLVNAIIVQYIHVARGTEKDMGTFIIFVTTRRKPRAAPSNDYECTRLCVLFSSVTAERNLMKFGICSGLTLRLVLSWKNVRFLWAASPTSINDNDMYFIYLIS